MTAEEKLKETKGIWFWSEKEWLRKCVELESQGIKIRTSVVGEPSHPQLPYNPVSDSVINYKHMIFWDET